jgi:hypothetical protein
MVAIPPDRTRAAALRRHRPGRFLGTTLLIGLLLVLVLDPDDDDDDQPPVLPSATTPSPPTTEAQAPKPGPLRMAKDFRLRPRKTGFKKRARTRHHLSESGPPLQSSQPRPRRGLTDTPHLLIAAAPTRLAFGDRPTAWLVWVPTPAPPPSVARPPRLTRAPPA